jgi:hypothetical protein
VFYRYVGVFIILSDGNETTMPRGPQYSDEELLDDLRNLADRLDTHPPLKRQMDEYGDHGARTYQLRFGSWSAAVEQAGFEAREPGIDYDERPERCPLCMTEETGLDFHHWRYGENEIGCYLCRECHDDIHRGKAKTSNVNWLVHCVRNLVEQHSERHDGEPDTEEILERYRLPDVEDLVAMAIEDRRD